MDDFLEKKPKKHSDAALATAARFSWAKWSEILLVAKVLSIIAILDVLSVGSIWMFSCLAVISSCSVSVAL